MFLYYTFISKKEVHFGGAKGDRTPDLNAASVALSQLSYGPKKFLILPKYIF